MRKHLLFLSLIAIISNCAPPKNHNNPNYEIFGTRWGGLSGKNFSLYLFKDSSFIYSYYPGKNSGYLIKDYGVWNRVDKKISLKTGMPLDGVVEAIPTNGNSDTLTIQLTESFQKAFPKSKIILFDTVVLLPVNGQIVINKRTFHASRQGLPWSEFDTYFVADVKLCSGPYFLSIFNTLPTVKVTIDVPKPTGLVKADSSKTVFAFEPYNGGLKKIENFTKIPIDSLYRRRCFNQRLSNIIERLAALDNDFTLKTDTTKPGRFHDSLDRVRKENVDNCKAILEDYGFPGFDLVGDGNSNGFWSVVQHLDHDVTYQKKALNLLFKQASVDNASWANVAFLTDRIRVNSNEQQLYGTQVQYDKEGNAIPKPLSNPSKVDSLRNRMGLDSLKTYLDLMTVMGGRKTTNFKITVPIKMQ